MLVKNKYKEPEGFRKSSAALSVILHLFFFFLLNIASLYIFETDRKRIFYVEIERSNSAKVPETIQGTGDMADGKSNRYAPVKPGIDDDLKEGLLLPDSLQLGEPGGTAFGSGTGTGKSGSPKDSIYTEKNIQLLKYLIAEDIKKNYGKTDQDRIRKEWRKYIEQHPYGPTYDGLLGKPGISIPIDDIIKLFK